MNAIPQFRILVGIVGCVFGYGVEADLVVFLLECVAADLHVRVREFAAERDVPGHVFL